MKILVVLGHPNKGSFNHAVAAAAVQTLRDNGHEVYFHDLYAEDFDPVLPGPSLVFYRGLGERSPGHLYLKWKNLRVGHGKA